MMNKQGLTTSLRSFAIAVLALVLNACSNSGDSGGGYIADPVATSLDSMGVNIDITPREGDNNVPLPNDYSPFGASRSFEQLDELVMLGFPLAASSGFNSQLTLLELDRIGSGASYDTDVLFSPATALTPWAKSIGDNPASIRSAARADIDKDGLEELAVVYRKAGQSSVNLQIYQDQTQGFAEAQSLPLSNEAVNDLAIAAGDFNGDGYGEFIVALVQSNSVSLLIVDNQDGVLSLTRSPIGLTPLFSGSEISVVIKTGNLDYDPSQEWVVVLNERFQQPGAGNPLIGSSRYFVFDDANNEFKKIGEAPVQASSGQINRSALVADVALGDIDGDNLDELVFAGLTSFDPNAQCDYSYLVFSLDDLFHDRALLGAKVVQPKIHNGCAATPGELRFVHVNTLDLDGDGRAEIQVNELVFEDFAQAAPWTPLVDTTGTVAEIPDASLYAANNGFSGRYTRLNSDIVVADLTADKRQDIISYSQASNRLEVWGLSEPDPNIDGGVVAGQWRMLKSIAIEAPQTDADIRPLLLPINVNQDSVAIAFDKGEHQLVFTEPVLIAALAAAPCYSNLGQNLDACRTSFGSAQSSSVQLENAFTITAGVSVGFETEFSALGVKVNSFELLGTLKRHASTIHSNAYTLTKRIVYGTGPLEDTVIFTTLPLDQYTYTILSHPDPDYIGSKVVVSMPRTPVEIQVERSFYNDNVVDGGPVIDASVFGHVPGNPFSYPDSNDKNNLLSKYSGYDVGPVSVGQGGGDTTLSINVATESGSGTSYGVDFDLEMKATIGVVVAGFSVGVSSENSLQIIHGNESEYTGAVANLPANQFSANAYNWGLFTYVKSDHSSGQQFEVIDYWVE